MGLLEMFKKKTKETVLTDSLMLRLASLSARRAKLLEGKRGVAFEDIEKMLSGKITEKVDEKKLIKRVEEFFKETKGECSKLSSLFQSTEIIISHFRKEMLDPFFEIVRDKIIKQGYPKEKQDKLLKIASELEDEYTRCLAKIENRARWVYEDRMPLTNISILSSERLAKEMRVETTWVRRIWNSTKNLDKKLNKAAREGSVEGVEKISIEISHDFEQMMQLLLHIVEDDEVMLKRIKNGVFDLKNLIDKAQARKKITEYTAKKVEKEVEDLIKVVNSELQNVASRALIERRYEQPLEKAA